MRSSSRSPGRFVCRCAGATRSVELSVTDTGVGIPPEDLPRRLRPLPPCRAHRARTYEGSGIGLALVTSSSRCTAARSTSTASLEPRHDVHRLAARRCAHLTSQSASAPRDPRSRRATGAPPYVAGSIAVAADAAADAAPITTGAVGRVSSSRAFSSPTTMPTCATTSAGSWRALAGRCRRRRRGGARSDPRAAPGRRGRRRHDAGARRVRAAARTSRGRAHPLRSGDPRVRPCRRRGAGRRA